MHKRNLIVAGLATLFALGSIVALKADDDVILSSCKADLQFSDSACQCVLKEAEKLTPGQRTAFVAAIQGDNAAIGQAMAQGALSAQDMQGLNQFMIDTPPLCQNQ